MTNKDFGSITKKVFINMPFKDMESGYMPLIKKYRFNLEIGIDHFSIDNFSVSFIKNRADELKDLGISMTIHAPYNEIFLGAPDRLIREASIMRMDAAFEVIEYFTPVSVVMHLNYETRRFGFIYDEWFSQVIPEIKRYAEKCGKINTILTLENVYEETPDAMKNVMDSLEGYPVYMCLDAGHVNAFSDTNLSEWLDKMRKHIAQFHLHDNDGTEDSHSPIGEGNINFEMIGNFISKMEKKPVITLEPHSEKDLRATLRGFEEKGLDRLL